MTFTKLVTTRRCDNQPDPEPHFYRNNAPFAIENEQKQIFTDASDFSTFCVSTDAYDRLVHRPEKQQTKITVRSDRQQAGTLPTLAVTHCKENSLSLIVSDLPTDCRAYLQRVTDSTTLLFVIL